MRYLVSIMVVSALVLLPAMAQAACPSDQELKEKSDSNLPVYGFSYLISNCNSVGWDFYVTRTEEGGTSTITPNIVGTTMYEEIPSSWSTGPHHIYGTADVTGASVQLRIDIEEGSDTGLFKNMQLDAHFFNE